MKTIWKFPINIEVEQVVVVPRGAKALALQLQNGMPQLWCEVESDHSLVPVTLYVTGTGRVMSPSAKKYLGSIQYSGYVWHYHAGEGLL